MKLQSIARTRQILQKSLVFTQVGRKPLRRADPRHYLNSYTVVDSVYPKRGFWTDDEMADLCHR